MATLWTVRPGRPGLGFTLLGATQVTLIATITVITVALPAIQRDLGLDESGLVLVASAYGLSFGGLLLLGGRLVDVFGHRRAFMAGMAVFGLASAAAGLAPGLGALLGARFAQGVGAALAAPAAMALLGVVFPDPGRRARATAVWGVLSSAGATAGNVLSGIAVTWMPWRWVFVVPVLIAAFAVAAVTRLIPAEPPRVRRHIDWLGAVLATSGLAALIYGVQHSVWTSLAGAALLGLFGLVEHRSRTPLMPLPFLGGRALPLAAVAITAAVMATAFFLLALYFQQVRSLSPLETSAVFLLPVPALIASGPVAGRLIPRLGAHRVLQIGLFTTAVGLLLLSLLGLPYAGLLVFPLGSGLTFASAAVLAVRGVSEADAGLAGGLLNTAMEIGPPLGLALMVSLAAAYSREASRGYAFTFRVAAAVFVLTALFALHKQHVMTAEDDFPPTPTLPREGGGSKEKAR